MSNMPKFVKDPDDITHYLDPVPDRDAPGETGPVPVARPRPPAPDEPGHHLLRRSIMSSNTESAPTTTTTETLSERIARLAPGEDCAARMDILADAADAGVTDKDLALLAKAPRIAEGDQITLPRHKLENLSRGKGWARCGSGRSAEWGKRCADGYRVGPGYWIVGGSDGYARKGEITWDVSHIRAGGKVWTVAV